MTNSGQTAKRRGADAVPDEVREQDDVRRIMEARDGTRRKFRVGRGLELDVRASGQMTWILRYRVRSTQQHRTFTIGRADADDGKDGMTLKDALARARTIRGQVDAGGDPQADIKAQRDATKQEREAAKLAPAMRIEALVRHALQMWPKDATIPDMLRAVKPLTRRNGRPLRPKTLRNFQGVARVHILPQLGDFDATKISKKEILVWFEANRARTTSQAIVAWSVLRLVFSWAGTRMLLEHSPFWKLQRPVNAWTRSRVLEPQELHFIVRALKILERGWGLGRYRKRVTRRRQPRFYASMVRLALLTGVRRDNARMMRASDLTSIDIDRRSTEAKAEFLPRWTIIGEHEVIMEDGTKSALDHIVPLSRQAQALIRKRVAAVAGRTDYLFPQTHAKKKKGPLTYASWSSKFIDDLRDMVQRLRAKHAKRRGRPVPPPMPRWTVHDMRRAIATHVVERLGFSAHVGSALLGHTPPNVSPTTLIYMRARLLRSRRRALQRWANWLDHLARKRPD